MNVRVFAAAALVAALAVVAVGATGASGGSAANTLTVWLQIDAQSGWPEVVAAANAQFKAQNPGWDVDVQYQTWGTHLAKFDATLAGGNAPDVIEMGNTEMTKYMAAGAFQDLSADLVPEPEHVARGPRRVRAVRRQALRRPVLRRVARRHLPHRPVQAGRTRRSRRASPSSRRSRKKLGAKNTAKDVLAGLHRRHGLVRRDELRLRLRRQDRRCTRKGKWVGTLDKPKALAGLAAYKRFFDAASRAPEDDRRGASEPVRRLRPGQRGVDASAPGWFTLLRRRLQEPQTAQFVMPSHTKGQPMPGFLGGSDLAVPIGANKAQAAAWITRLHRQRVDDARSARRATSRTRRACSATASTSARPAGAGSSRPRRTGSTSRTGTSSAPCWRGSSTGKSTIKDAAAVASDNITSTLNQRRVDRGDAVAAESHCPPVSAATVGSRLGGGAARRRRSRTS